MPKDPISYQVSPVEMESGIESGGQFIRTLSRNHVDWWILAQMKISGLRCVNFVLGIANNISGSLNMIQMYR